MTAPTITYSPQAAELAEWWSVTVPAPEREDVP